MPRRWTLGLSLALAIAVPLPDALALKPQPAPTITSILLGGAGGGPAIFAAATDGRVFMARYNAWDYSGSQPFQEVARLPGKPVSMEWVSNGWGVMVCLENGDIYRSDSSIPITFTLVENILATVGSSGSIAGPLPANPNPKSQSGTGRIEYETPRPGAVQVRIFDVQGRLVWSTRSEHGAAGRYSVAWDAKDAASGVYFAKIQLPDGSVTSSRIVMTR